MPGPYESYADIPRLTKYPGYHVTVSFNYLLDHLNEWDRFPGGLDLEPDFQRGHVWSEEQQIAFVEYALRGGLQVSSGVLLFNCADWDGGCTSPIQIVDGLQRMTAACRFLRGELPAFESYIHEFKGLMSITDARFDLRVNNLPAREDVLRWYLELNTGGIAHSPEEILRVRGLLDEELSAYGPTHGR